VIEERTRSQCPRHEIPSQFTVRDTENYHGPDPGLVDTGLTGLLELRSNPASGDTRTPALTIVRDLYEADRFPACDVAAGE
jgi:hypothetical protein